MVTGTVLFLANFPMKCKGYYRSPASLIRRSPQNQLPLSIPVTPNVNF